MDLHIRHRLAGLAIHYPSAHGEAFECAADGDIDFCCFAAFTYLNHHSLRDIASVGIESNRKRTTTSSNATIDTLLPDEYFVPSRPYSEYPVTTSIVSLKAAPKVMGRAASKVSRQEVDTLFHNGLTLSIRDRSGNHSAANEIKVDSFDVLTFVNYHRLNA